MIGFLSQRRLITFLRINNICSWSSQDASCTKLNSLVKNRFILIKFASIAFKIMMINSQLQ